MPLPRTLIDPKRIYLEPAVTGFARGREVLARYPEAERVKVESHWRIPELYGDAELADDWLRMKRDVLVLASRRASPCARTGARPTSSRRRPPTAAPCSYCYVPRRKGYANPVSVFVNIDQLCAAVARHAARQGTKPEPNTIDPTAWVYDLGENGDLSLDALVSDNVRDLVAAFRALPNAKGSFATKLVNPDLLAYDPQERTCIRFSLMSRRSAMAAANPPAPPWPRPPPPQSAPTRRRGRLRRPWRVPRFCANRRLRT